MSTPGISFIASINFHDSPEAGSIEKVYQVLAILALFEFPIQSLTKTLSRFTGSRASMLSHSLTHQARQHPRSSLLPACIGSLLHFAKLCEARPSQAVLQIIVKYHKSSGSEISHEILKSHRLA